MEHLSVLLFIPIIAAVAISFWTNKILIGLGVGISSTLLLAFFFPELIANTTPVMDMIRQVFEATFFDFDHFAILIFTLALAATIGILNDSGALSALLRPLLKAAKSKRQTKLTAFFLGLLIFFDDYTNSLLIGNLMKKPFKKAGISAAKLAYIIDSTAAPVASLAIMSTWIGFEVNEIEQSLIASPLGGNITIGAYGVFLRSIPYSFYPILTLGAVFWVLHRNINIGPMKEAEELAASEPTEEGVLARKEEDRDTSSSKTAWTALLFLILSTTFFIIYTGFNNSEDPSFLWSHCLSYIGASSTVLSLLISTLSTLLLTLAIAAPGIGLSAQVESIKNTCKKVLAPLSVLYLAWLFAGLLKSTQLADYIIQIIQTTELDPRFFPAFIFIGAAIISFATGSSWGTMSILFPICIPALLTFSISENGLNEVLFFSGIASILGGAVWGDHCSPLSDTTIISSIASDCPHVIHVKTQLPYAIITGASVVLGALIPVNFGLPFWAGIILSAFFTLLIFNILNRSTSLIRR